MHKFRNPLKFLMHNIVICVDTNLSHNSSNFVSGTTEIEPVMISSHVKEILEILEELDSNANANFTG